MIKTAFYDTKEYDKPSFEKYGQTHDIKFRFLETKLNEDSSLRPFSFPGRVKRFCLINPSSRV